MSRWSKRIKEYERHILLGLVILLLVSFSITGALTCTGPESGARDLGGSFQATPTDHVSLSSNDVAARWNRYNNFRWQVGTPSLRYMRFLFGDNPQKPLPALWAHLMASEAARAVGYLCGEEYQLPLAIRTAVTNRMGGLNFTDALYDKFLREFYRGSASDFQDVTREVAVKDDFLRPLIEAQRYGITYEEAYEAWKKQRERVDLLYVALRGRDFVLEARKVENVRTDIQARLDALTALDRTARTWERVDARVQGWKAEHDGTPPGSLGDIAGLGDTKDAWGHELIYTVDGAGYTLSSPGRDGELGGADDVTRDTVAELRTLAVLSRVGDALRRWHEAASQWPADLAKLREAPSPGALPPLTRDERDGWNLPLQYEPGEGGAAPRLFAFGADGLANTADDLVAEVSEAQVSVPPGPRVSVYADVDAKDAWDQAYRVRLRDAAGRTFTIQSAGPDGVFDTDDDVKTGNGAELRAFYEQPEVRADYVQPFRRRFRALYVHLPLVPDDVMRRLWTAFPDFHPDESAAYNRWRTLQEPYYEDEDPADPEAGYGAELSRRVAPDHESNPVPDRSIFGEAPSDLLPADSPDSVPYLEKGWREILLREEFFELLLNDLLRQVRDRQDARKAWEMAKAAFDRGEGEDPGAEPGELTFDTLLGTTLAPYLPGEADAPYLAYFETKEPLTRQEWEADPNLGDINLTVAGLQPLSEPGQYSAIPTILNNGRTKAILQNIEALAERQPELAEVREQVFERYLEGRGLDLARDALQDLQKRYELARNQTPGGPPPEGQGEEAPAPASDEVAARAWEETLAAWGDEVGAPYEVGETGWFIGPRPPTPVDVPEGLAPDEALRVRRKDRVRQTAYETIRPASDGSGEGATPGSFGRRILRDDSRDGTDSVFLVRVRDRRFPPAESFSPREYGFHVALEVFGDLLGGRMRQARPGDLPRGMLPLALYRYFFDIDWLRTHFDLRTQVDLAAEPR